MAVKECRECLNDPLGDLLTANLFLAAFGGSPRGSPLVESCLGFRFDLSLGLGIGLATLRWLRCLPICTNSLLLYLPL